MARSDVQQGSSPSRWFRAAQFKVASIGYIEFLYYARAAVLGKGAAIHFERAANQETPSQGIPAETIASAPEGRQRRTLHFFSPSGRALRAE